MNPLRLTTDTRAKRRLSAALKSDFQMAANPHREPGDRSAAFAPLQRPNRFAPKRLALSLAVLLPLPGLACAGAAVAEEVDSEVIHNYTYASIGYGFLRGLNGASDGNGAVSDLSLNLQRLVLGATGGYFQAQQYGVTINPAYVGGSAGYVVGLAQNHVNLIPSFLVSYTQVTYRIHYYGDVTTHATSIGPGFAASYAFNDRFSMEGDYAYACNLDAHSHVNRFALASNLAVAEQVGLVPVVRFDTDNGFIGFSLSVAFHF